MKKREKLYHAPIPKEAMPVVKILRSEVHRPQKLPKKSPRLERLRWYLKKEAYDNLNGFCPMGLHLLATDARPESAKGFLDGEDGRITDCAVESFFRWWDRERDPRKAVDAVWPPKRKTIKK